MIPWRREWLPTPVLLPGKFHGQRSLAGYRPWGCKESVFFFSLTLLLFFLSIKVFFSIKYIIIIAGNVSRAL